MSWFKKFITDLFVNGFKKEKSSQERLSEIADEILTEYQKELESLSKR